MEAVTSSKNGVAAFSDSADRDGWAGERVSYSRSFAEFCVSRDGWAGERMSYSRSLV